MSEHFEEPVTIMPSEFGEHLLSSLPIKLFQIDDELYTKFNLDTSRLILGKSIKKFLVLGLGQNNSDTEIGVLYLRILNKSMNVC